MNTNLGISTKTLSALLVRYRLIAFVSEVGESIRPVPGVLTWHVNAFYLVSWMYVITDTAVQAVEEASVEGRIRQVGRVVLFMSLFHGIATMLIPAIAIHEAVRATKALLARLATCRSCHERLAAAAAAAGLWMPTLVGLSLIPAMPIVDHPLHSALKFVFDRTWPKAKRPNDTSRAKSARRLEEAEAAHDAPGAACPLAYGASPEQAKAENAKAKAKAAEEKAAAAAAA